MSQTMLNVQQIEYQDRLKAQGEYGFSGASEACEKWKKQLVNAKISWAKLTEQELIKSQGSAKQLAGLVQQRYAISYRDAEKQVDAFLKKNSASINQSAEKHYE